VSPAWRHRKSRHPLRVHAGRFGAAQGDADLDVEGADEHHREDEQEERGHLEGVPHVFHPRHRNVTDERLGHSKARPRVFQVVVRTGVDRVREGGDAGDDPDNDDVAYSPWEAGHGLGAEGVTDGQVALYCERGYGEYRGWWRHLG